MSVEYWDAPDTEPCPECGSVGRTCSGFPPERKQENQRLHKRDCSLQYGRASTGSEVENAEQ